MENQQNPSIYPQMVSAIVQTIVIFVLYLSIESLYNSYLGYNTSRVAVYPVTGGSSGGNVKIFSQDPNNANSLLLPHSENQLTGIEFSYTTFLYISQDTDRIPKVGNLSFTKAMIVSPFPSVVLVSSSAVCQK